MRIIKPSALLKVLIADYANVSNLVRYRQSHSKFHCVINRRRITPPPSILVKFNM